MLHIDAATRERFMQVAAQITRRAYCKAEGHAEDNPLIRFRRGRVEHGVTIDTARVEECRRCGARRAIVIPDGTDEGEPKIGPWRYMTSPR